MKKEIKKEIGKTCKKEARTGGNKVNLNVRRNKRGKYYIQIEFTNGRILAHSEDYSSQAKAIDSLTSFVVAMQRKQFSISI